MQKVTDPGLLAQLNGGTAAPAPQRAPQQAPGVIVGRPKAPDPYKVQQDAESDARADANLDLSQQSAGRSTLGQVQDYRKEFSSSPPVKTYGIAITSLSNAVKRGEDGSGDVALIYDYAKAMDPESVVRESEVGMAQSGQSLIDSAVAKFKKEFGVDGGGALTPELRARLKREIFNATMSRRQAYEQQRNYYSELAKRGQYDPFDVVGPDIGEPYRKELGQFSQKGYKFSDEQMAARAEGQNTGAPTEQPNESLLKPLAGERVGELNTAALGPGEKFVFDENGQPIGILGVDGTVSGYSQIADEVSQRDAEAEMKRRLGDGNTISDIPAFDNGVSLGFSDELYGIRGGLGELFSGGSFKEGYQRERDVERAAIDASTKEHGIIPGLAGSVVAPAGVLGRASTAGQFAKQGATIGGVAGFGRGEGAADSALRAGGGALLGAGAGYGASKAGQAVNALLKTPAAQKASGALSSNRANTVNREVVEAGERQNIPIRQPDARPETRNAFAAVEASPTQSDKVRRVLDADKGAVQSRLSEVGGSGKAVDNFTMGEGVQGAGQRYIAKSREQANALYRRAETAAGETRVPPTQALKAIDDNIAELTANGPKANSGQISYLKDLKSDLSRGDLSIEQLRSIRTGMRGQVSERNLTATDAERRVGQVIQAASADIERGLASNPKALEAYKAADKFYQEKQTFIKDVVQRFTGTRNAPLSAEQAASKFQAMMRDKGDYKRFSEMLQKLDPEERADMAATVAENLGVGRNGEFSLAGLATNVSKMNPRALRDLFGEDGAKAIADLRIISRAKADTMGGLNNSKSGVVMAANNQFKDVLLGAFGGGMAGVPGAMGGMAARGALERFSSARAARLLLNPDFTKWLRQTPASTSPEVINRHFDRLNKLAARDSVFLMDAKALQDYLRSAVSQTPSRAAAESQQEEDRR